MRPLGPVALSPSKLTRGPLPTSSLRAHLKHSLSPKTEKHHLPGHYIPVQNEKPAERRIQEALGFPSPPTLKKANFRETPHVGRLPPGTSNVIRPVEVMPGATCSRSRARSASLGGHLGALRVCQSHKEESPGSGKHKAMTSAGGSTEHGGSLLTHTSSGGPLAAAQFISVWSKRLHVQKKKKKSPLGCLGLPTLKVTGKRKGHDFPVRVSRASSRNARLSEDPVQSRIHRSGRSS